MTIHTAYNKKSKRFTVTDGRHRRLEDLDMDEFLAFMGDFQARPPAEAFGRARDRHLDKVCSRRTAR